MTELTDDGSLDERPLPHARIFEVYSDPKVRTVRVRCPFCGGSHIHGWPLGDRRVGERVAHCHGSRAAGRTYLVIGEELAPS